MSRSHKKWFSQDHGCETLEIYKGHLSCNSQNVLANIFSLAETSFFLCQVWTTLRRSQICMDLQISHLVFLCHCPHSPLSADVSSLLYNEVIMQIEEKDGSRLQCLTK